MAEISLRPYQRDFIKAVHDEFMQGHKRVVGVAPCGAGKTIMTGWMIRSALRRGKKSVFLVHRKELIEQTSRTFNALDIPHGIIAAGTKSQPNLPVQIASVQTLVKRLDYVPAPDFLICDECHHILANTYKKVIDTYPKAFLLGVTATPMRTGGITLADTFDSMVESLSVNELIALGNLTRFDYFTSVSNIDLSGVKVTRGEYDNAQLEQIMSKRQIIGDIVTNYKTYADGKNAICYCVNVAHCKRVTEEFLAQGIRAAHVDGETPKDERAYLVNQFRRGNIQVLCNAELFGEGFDVPNCHAVILARPTNSLILHIQQSMRALRPDPNAPDKVAVIIDHVENYKRHGYPNAKHFWSLEENEPKIRGETPMKDCPNCGTEVPLGTQFCPSCGYEFEREGVANVPGTTVKAKVSFATDPTKKNSFTKPDEFLEIAKQRKHKIGWVAYKSLDYAQSYDDCLHIAEVCGYQPGWAWYKWREIAHKERA